MFLSALQTYVVLIIIAIVILQYVFAVFCLLKLAYLDVKKEFYILWNLFILIVFFIGGAVFLWYYYKHPELRVSKTPENTAPQDPESDSADNQAACGAETQTPDSPAESAEDPQDGAKPE